MKGKSNPVAKHLRTFNKATVQRDRKKDSKRGKAKYKKDIYKEEGDLEKARDNVGSDSCWDGYKATDTKKKGGKLVPDCKKESVEQVEEGTDKLISSYVRGDLKIKTVRRGTSMSSPIFVKVTGGKKDHEMGPYKSAAQAKSAVNKMHPAPKGKRTMESIGEGFSKAHIEALRKEFSTLNKVDPTGPAYKKMTKFLQGRSAKELEGIARAKIKFLSQTAASVLKSKHGVTIPFKDIWAESVEQVDEGIFGKFGKKAEPKKPSNHIKAGETHNIGGTKVKFHKAGKQGHIGYSWKKSNGKEGYEEYHPKDHKNHDAVTANISSEIKYQAKNRNASEIKYQAKNRNESVEQIDELSNKKLASYVSKASSDAKSRMKKGKVGDDKHPSRFGRKTDNRMDGIDRALNKIPGKKGSRDAGNRRTDGNVSGTGSMNVVDKMKANRSKGVAKKYYGEDVDHLSEGISVEQFDRLKSKQKVTIDFSSAMGGSSSKEFIVSRKSKLKGGKIEKITLKNVKNPTGVKSYLYKRDGKNVSMAQGDMGVSAKSLKEGMRVEHYNINALMEKAIEIQYTDRPDFGEDSALGYGRKEGYKEVGVIGTGPLNAMVIFKLNAFDKKYTKGVRLKAGEEIFRYTSRGTVAGKIMPLIKVNMKRGLAYYLTQESSAGEIEEPVFETKAQKLKFIRLLTSAYKPGHIVKESVEQIDEIVAKLNKNGEIEMTKKKYAKVHRDFKGKWPDGEHYVTQNMGKQGMTQVPVKFVREDVEQVDENDIKATPPKAKPTKVGQKAKTPSHIGSKYPDNKWVVKKNTGTSKAYRPLEWVLESIEEKMDSKTKKTARSLMRLGDNPRLAVKTAKAGAKKDAGKNAAYRKAYESVEQTDEGFFKGLDLKNNVKRGWAAGLQDKMKKHIHPDHHDKYNIGSVMSTGDARNIIKKAKSAGHMKESVEQTDEGIVSRGIAKVKAGHYDRKANKSFEKAKGALGYGKGKSIAKGTSDEDGFSKHMKQSNDYERKAKKIRSDAFRGKAKKESVEQVDELTQREKEMIADRKAKRDAKAGRKDKKTRLMPKTTTYVRPSKGEDDHIVMQLRKAQDSTNFGNGAFDIRVSPVKGAATVQLKKSQIDKLLNVYNKLEKPEQKRKYRITLMKTLRSMQQKGK